MHDSNPTVGSCLYQWSKIVLKCLLFEILFVTITSCFFVAADEIPVGNFSFSGMLDITSNLAESNSGSSSDLVNFMKMNYWTDQFGLRISSSPNATTNPSWPVSQNTLGGGYSTSPFYIVPDEYNARVFFGEKRIEIVAGSIEDDQFAPHVTSGGPPMQDKLATNANQGLEVLVRPVNDWLLGVYFPLSLGTNSGIMKASVAAKYSVSDGMTLNIGWIGANAISTDRSNSGALFVNAQVISQGYFKSFVGYEFSQQEAIRGPSFTTTNASYFEAGASLDFLDHWTFSLNGEFDLFQSVYLAENYGYGAIARVEYQVVKEMVAGCAIWMNRNAVFCGFFASGPANDLGNVGFNTGTQINPYLTFPVIAGNRPMGSLNVGFDFNILTSGNTWALPVDTTIFY